MGLRTAPATPAQTASNGSDQGDFESAFASLLDETPGQTQPKAEDLQDETEEEKPAPAKEADPLDEIEKKQIEQREKWKVQKENKELKARLAELEGKAKTGIDVDSDNPLRDIRKLKGWSKDDIVNKALEALEDEGFSTEEAQEKVDKMSYEDIYKRVKEDLAKEQAEQEKTKKESEEINGKVTAFKNEIKDFATKNADKYPLIDGLGGLDLVYQTIEDDFKKKSEEYDFEYAAKNMMKIDQATKLVNEKLASSVKNALKSNHVRQFILAAIKEEGGTGKPNDSQLEDFFQLEDEPQTLTNSNAKRLTDPKDSRDMTDEERFQQAFAYLD